MTNFTSVTKENNVNDVITEEVMALQNVFVFKKFRFACLCHSCTADFTLLTSSFMTTPLLFWLFVNTGFQ